MKNLLSAVLIAAFVMPVMQGCKRGEEDPGISLRSRNGRVTGTWTLKSYDMSSASNSTEKVTNDVNDDEYDETIITTWSESYNGSSLVSNYTYKEDWTDIFMWYDGANTQWRDQEVVYTETTSDNSTAQFDFTISLYTDNTYEITETSGNASGSWAFEMDEDWDDDNDLMAFDWDADDDGDWSTTGTSTSVTQGSWYWEDETKKGKLFLNAGPIKGKVVRLSSKEMWVEIQYAELGGIGENTSSVGSDTDVQEDVNQLQYSNNNPADNKDDDETTFTTWNNTETFVMWVFEKTDKNSKRHKATTQ